MPLIKVFVRSGLDVGDNTGTILATGQAKERWIQTANIVSMQEYLPDTDDGASFRYYDPASPAPQQIITNDTAVAIAASANA